MEIKRSVALEIQQETGRKKIHLLPRTFRFYGTGESAGDCERECSSKVKGFRCYTVLEIPQETAREILVKSEGLGLRV